MTRLHVLPVVLRERGTKHTIVGIAKDLVLNSGCLIVKGPVRMKLLFVDTPACVVPRPRLLPSWHPE